MSKDHVWPRVYIDYGLTIIIEIASKCEFETLDTYEENIEFYESNNFSYIPLIADYKYYNIESDSLKEIQGDQWVVEDRQALPAMELLEEHDFLLIHERRFYFHPTEGGLEIVESLSHDLPESEVYYTIRNLLNDHPEYGGELNDILEERDSIYIVTLADLNDRQVRAVLYRLISSVEVILAHAIKEANPNEESLINNMNVTSIGRWKKAEFEAGQLHPVEYMNFGELKHIGSISPEVRQTLGYPDREEYENVLRGMQDLRNKVMHPTKNLIKHTNDLARVNKKIRRLENFIEKCGGEINRRYRS